MAIKTRQMFHAECDECGLHFNNSSGGTYFLAEEGLVNNLKAEGWKVEAVKSHKGEDTGKISILCPNCKKG